MNSATASTPRQYSPKTDQWMAMARVPTKHDARVDVSSDSTRRKTRTATSFAGRHREECHEPTPIRSPPHRRTVFVVRDFCRHRLFSSRALRARATTRTPVSRGNESWCKRRTPSARQDGRSEESDSSRSNRSTTWLSKIGCDEKGGIARQPEPRSRAACGGGDAPS